MSLSHQETYGILKAARDNSALHDPFKLKKTRARHGEALSKRRNRYVSRIKAKQDKLRLQIEELQAKLDDNESL